MNDTAEIVVRLFGVLQSIASSYVHVHASVNNSLPIPRTELPCEIPRLVAVSKTFPAEYVEACYKAGHRHFAEDNQKKMETKVLALKQSGYNDIRWHYIGRVQPKKIHLIVKIPGLWCIEIIETIDEATATQKACDNFNVQSLNIFLKVNTSQADDTFQAKELKRLAEHIATNCSSLRLIGLMTPGASTESSLTEEHFLRLASIRRKFCAMLNIEDVRKVELSMGSSNNYEAAIRHGATNVKIGKSIFSNQSQDENFLLIETLQKRFNPTEISIVSPRTCISIASHEFCRLSYDDAITAVIEVIPPIKRSQMVIEASHPPSENIDRAVRPVKMSPKVDSLPNQKIPATPQSHLDTAVFQIGKRNAVIASECLWLAGSLAVRNFCLAYNIEPKSHDSNSTVILYLSDEFPEKIDIRDWGFLNHLHSNSYEDRLSLEYIKESVPSAEALCNGLYDVYSANKLDERLFKNAMRNKSGFKFL